MLPKKSQNYFIRYDDSVTVIVNGKQYSVSDTHPNFKNIIDKLYAKDFDVIDMISVKTSIIKKGISKKYPNLKVFIEDDNIFFEDTKSRKIEKLNNALTERILKSIGSAGGNFYADALMALLHNIKKNPLKDISAELYDWFLSGENPITKDGCILAYKKVRLDYLDHYSKSMDNSPGKTVKITQSLVDTDRSNECSRGLHFASLKYLSNYSGDYKNSRVVIVKVNPRHIFAIPRDYNCQKGRCSQYEVVGEYHSDNREKVEAFKDSFIDEDNKLTAAPDIKFTKDAFKKSLFDRALEYGLVNSDGLVGVHTIDGVKHLVPVKNINDKCTLMSFNTKSVYKLVKDKVSEIEND